MGDRLRLVVIDSDAVTDCIEVIVRASAYLTAFYQTLDQQLLIHQQVDHDGLHVVFLEQLIQGLSLGDRTGVTVEDRTLAIGRKTGDIVLDNTEHHLVRHKVTLRDDRIDLFAQLTACSNLGAQHIARREMLYTVFLRYKCGLCALSATRGSA